MATQKQKRVTKASVDDIQLVKIAFPKKKKKINVEEDLGLEGYGTVEFVMWADPSVRTIARVLSPLSKAEEDITNDDGDAYFDAIHQLFLETNVEGISFDTLAETIESYDHPHLPYGFIGQVAAFYCTKLITESEALKKVFNLSEEVETSGGDSSEKE